jgi:transposase-like protein
MARKLAVKAVVESRYWRESTARVVVDAWRESGETVAAFAKRHGVDERRLARWAQRLGAKGAAVVPFHPVRVVGGADSAVTAAPIEIAVSGGYCVRVPPHFDAEDLRRVLTVLAPGPSC